jgi:FMN reductase
MTMTERQPHIVGIGGTTRPFSSTEKALRFALRSAEKHGATTRGFFGAELAELPMYAPENPERHPRAQELIEELRRADGIILASPGYHGGVSGLVKNAIDYTEDLGQDERAYFTGLPMGCIATGAGWQGVVTTLEQLRTIAHALRAWCTPLGAGINTVAVKVYDDDGEVIDERASFQLAMVGQEVAEFAALRLRSIAPASAS